jgi:DNA repair exonuclease SbcCD nuclease subunit
MCYTMVVTDTHMGVNKSNNHLLNVNYSLFKSLCETAKERGVRRLIHTGDWFDTREHINTKVIDMSHKVAELLTETFDEVFIIVGNHDCYYKTSMEPTSLRIFSKYKKIHIINKITIVDNSVLVPWLWDMDEFTNIDADYVFGHFEINNAVMNVSGRKAQSSLSPGFFRSRKKVISGHYHTRSTIGNIEYIGSPYHLDFNDSGPRGYYLFDNGGLEFFEFNDYPKCMTLYGNQEIKKEDVKNNNVRLIFVEEMDSIKYNSIIEKVNSYGPYRLFTQVKIDGGFSDETREFYFDSLEIPFAEMKDNKDLWLEYLEKSETPGYLKKSMLLRIAEELYEKVI